MVSQATVAQTSPNARPGGENMKDRTRALGSDNDPASSSTDPASASRCVGEATSSPGAASKDRWLVEAAHLALRAEGAGLRRVLLQANACQLAREMCSGQACHVRAAIVTLVVTTVRQRCRALLDWRAWRAGGVDTTRNRNRGRSAAACRKQQASGVRDGIKSQRLVSRNRWRRARILIRAFLRRVDLKAMTVLAMTGLHMAADALYALVAVACHSVIEAMRS